MKVEVPVELGGRLVDGVDDDGPGADLSSSSHATSKGIHQEMRTKSTILLGVIDS